MDIAIIQKRNNVETNADVPGKAIKDILTWQKTQLTDEEAKKQEQSNALPQKNKSRRHSLLSGKF